MDKQGVARYSDAELAEFRALIEEKLAKAQKNLDNLQNQIIDTTENNEDGHGGDWIDDSSVNSEVEMLNNMAIRQRKYLRELENALIRIHNKSFGICIVTGELIDKRRLLAVPTTTKSMAAKSPIQAPSLKPPLVDGNDNDAEENKTPKSSPEAAVYKRKIITKIVRRSSAPTPSSAQASSVSPTDEDLDFDKTDMILDNEDQDLIFSSLQGLDSILEEE